MLSKMQDAGMIQNCGWFSKLIKKIVKIAVGTAAGAIFAATIGMSAIKAGTAFAETLADGVEQVIDKVSGKILSILIKGVEYATVAVTTSIIYELEKNSYHLALLANDGVVYISLTPIDRTLATWATRLNIPIYTFYSENAYQIAKDAGNGLAPNLDEAHIKKDGVLRKGIFFNHWHTFNHQGHCLFGVPFIQL